MGVGVGVANLFYFLHYGIHGQSQWKITEDKTNHLWAIDCECIHIILCFLNVLLCPHISILPFIFGAYSISKCCVGHVTIHPTNVKMHPACQVNKLKVLLQSLDLSLRRKCKLGGKKKFFLWLMTTFWYFGVLKF